MANSYSAPNFDIDTSTNLAGLALLKGSAPSGTDLCFVHNNAELTIDGACDMLEFHNGNNPTLNAAVKTGNIYFLGAYLIDIYNATVNRGLVGTGTTSTWKFIGQDSANYLVIKSHTAQKVSMQLVGAQKAQFENVEFRDTYHGFYVSNALSSIKNALAKGNVFGLYIQVLPAFIIDCIVDGGTYGMACYSGDILTKNYFSGGNSISFIKRSTGACNILIGPGFANNTQFYFYFRVSAYNLYKKFRRFIRGTIGRSVSDN